MAEVEYSKLSITDLKNLVGMVRDEIVHDELKDCPKVVRERIYALEEEAKSLRKKAEYDDTVLKQYQDKYGWIDAEDLRRFEFVRNCRVQDKMNQIIRDSAYSLQQLFVNSPDWVIDPLLPMFTKDAIELIRRSKKYRKEDE